MEEVQWNPLKNEWLRIARGVSFDDLVKRGTLWKAVEHPTRPHQELWLFEYHRYVWAVPCVRDRKGVFLKTLYPSRKYTKLYQWRATP